MLYNEIMQNEFEVSWSAPEYEYREKDVSWYWKSIIVAVVLIALAVWQHNVLFVVFLVIGEIMIIVFGNRPPTITRFHIGEKGFRINDGIFHPYTQLESFSIVIHEHSHWDDLILHTKNRLNETVRVKVPKDMLAKVHRSLSLVLEETVYEETLVEALEHFLGF